MGVGLPNGALGGGLGQNTVGPPRLASIGGGAATAERHPPARRDAVGSENGRVAPGCWVTQRGVGSLSQLLGQLLGGRETTSPSPPPSLSPSLLLPFPSPPPSPPLSRARRPLRGRKKFLGCWVGRFAVGSPKWGVGWGVGSGNGRVAPGSWTWPSSRGRWVTQRGVGSENGRVAPGCWVTQHPVGCLYAPGRPPSTSHGFLGFLHGPGGLPRALSRSYPGRRGRWRARWPPSAPPATVRPQTELPLPVPEGPRSLLVGRRGSRRLTRHRGDWGPQSHSGPERRVGRASEVRSLYYSVHRKTHMGSATTRWGSAGDGEVGNISFRVRRGRLPSLGPIGGVWGGGGGEVGWRQRGQKVSGGLWGGRRGDFRQVPRSRAFWHLSRGGTSPLFSVSHTKVAGCGPYFGPLPAVRRIRSLACSEDI